ncbi:MAG TPA: hypothetical protein VFT65_15920 [Candidatus Angelobacter sp.]|nr:hypothetical protein [Candidatus Angelobacter sp.]
MFGNAWIAASWMRVGLSLLVLTNPCGLKNFSNRQEGCNIKEDAAADYKLVGLHGTFQPFGRNSNLQVRFFLPLSGEDGQRIVAVQAVEVQGLSNYFMQSKDSIRWHEGDWNTFAPWPTKDVIDPLNLFSQNIAVLAFYKTGTGQPVYLPVDISTQEIKSGPRKYTFSVFHGQSLQKLDLILTDKAGVAPKIHKPELTCRPEIHPGCHYSDAGNTVTFDLDLSALPDGQYRLKLIGYKVDGSKPTTEVLFYHHQ